MAVVRTEAGEVVGYTVAMDTYWAAVVKQEAQVVCLDCLDDDMGRVRDRLLRGEEVKGYRRIYIDEEWQYYPQCCVCDAVLEYVTLIPIEEELTYATYTDEARTWGDSRVARSKVYCLEGTGYGSGIPKLQDHRCAKANAGGDVREGDV